MAFDLRNIGLRNVLVADTLICKIDPKKGELRYRGYNIVDLVKRSSFEEVTYLLLFHKLPNKNEISDLTEKMKSLRKPPEYITKFMKKLPTTASTMSVLQSTIPLIQCFECEDEKSKEKIQEISIKLCSLFPSLIAHWHRVRNKLAPVEPTDFDHASNFLYMLTGIKPESDMGRIFDQCLILHAEHSFNASTFAAREVASTGASIYAATSAAIGALSGELHGGANIGVMDMLESIGEIDNVQRWIENRIETNQRIMGLGHAMYKTMDPRAKILKDSAKRISKIKDQSKWFEITKKIEEYAPSQLERKKRLKIFPNVDLYTPSIYHSLNIPKDLFTPIFAMARVSGWCAHIIEEKFAEAQPKPVLYRPKAKYIGKYCGIEDCEYKPLEAR
jgi:citrate synthase